VTARTQGGAGWFFRELTFDDASGAVSVRDSDPFATGKEIPNPPVVEKALTLSAAEREAVANDLLRICPDAKAMAARCAPGGCSSLEVRPRAGAPTTVQDPATVSRVMQRLMPFFPGLREQR
jgi:hypothetical protein